MGRSNYSDDLDERDMAMWRGRVASAMRGKRGQALLRDCLAALDAMPDKRLIAAELEDETGNVCLLGAGAKHRGVPDVLKLDPEEHEKIGARLNVAYCLVQEIEYVNDEAGPWDGSETPEQRWVRVRKWLEQNVAATA